MYILNRLKGKISRDCSSDVPLWRPWANSTFSSPPPTFSLPPPPGKARAVLGAADLLVLAREEDSAGQSPSGALELQRRVDKFLAQWPGEPRPRRPLVVEAAKLGGAAWWRLASTGTGASGELGGPLGGCAVDLGGGVANDVLFPTGGALSQA
jgi:hypothetical protein